MGDLGSHILSHVGFPTQTGSKYKNTEANTEIWLVDVDCIQMTQYRDKGQALVNTIMNFRGSIKGWGFLDQLRNF
jgi:hypothetical protein